MADLFTEDDFSDVASPTTPKPAEDSLFKTEDFQGDESKYQFTSTAGSFGGGFVRNVAPMAAFMAAAPAGAKAGAIAGAFVPGAGETGISELIGGAIGGLVAGSVAAWAAHKAQSKIADVVAPESIFGSKMEEQQQTEHPLATTLGSFMAIGKPSPMNVIKAAKTLASEEGKAALKLIATQGKKGIESLPHYMQKETENVFNVAMGGGINSAFNAYDQIQSGKFSATELLKAAGEGLLFNKPWIHAQNPNTKLFDSFGKEGQDAIAEASQGRDVLGPGTPSDAVANALRYPPVPPTAAQARRNALGGFFDGSSGGSSDNPPTGSNYPWNEPVPIEPGSASAFTIPPGGTIPVANQRMRIPLPTRKDGQNASEITSGTGLDIRQQGGGVGESASFRQQGEVANAGEVKKAPDEIKPPSLTPALLIDGKPVTGGDSHPAILRGLTDDQKIQYMTNPNPDSLHVFVDENGTPLDRKQAGAKFDEMMGNPPGTTPELQSEMLPRKAAPKPLNPGGAPENLTPEQKALSDKNNGRKAFAEANGVPYIEGESMAETLKRVQAKNAGGIPVLPTVVPKTKAPTPVPEYSILDSVKDHSGLGGPDLVDAMKQMAAGKTAAQVVAPWRDNYKALSDILQTAYEVYRKPRGSTSAVFNDLKKAYSAAGLGGGRKHIDTTHGAMQAAFEAGGGFPGGMPADTNELITRAFQAAQDKVSGKKPVIESRKSMLESADAAAAVDKKFDRDIKAKTKGTEDNPVDQLQKGAEFTLNGAKFRVLEIKSDEDGNIESVTLDDGNKYGTQTVDGKKMLAMRRDIGSLQGGFKEEGFLPEEKKAEPIKPVVPASPKNDIGPRLTQLAKKKASGEKLEVNENVFLKSVREKNPELFAKYEAEVAKLSGIVPDTRTAAEIISQDLKVKVTLPEGATMLRVWTEGGKYKKDLNLTEVAAMARNNFNFQGTTISKLEAGSVGKNKEFKAIAGEVKSQSLKEPNKKAAEGESGQGLTIDAATAAIHSALGTKGELPRGITVVHDETAPWGARIDDRNRITVNAAQISSPARAHQVILEEGLHGTWFDPGVQRAWRDIRRSVHSIEIADMRMQREPILRQFAARELGVETLSDEQFQKYLEDNKERIRSDMAEEVAIDELIHRQTNRNLVTKLLDAVRAAFKKTFGIDLPGTNRQQLIDAAVNFLKGERESLPGKRFVADNAVITAPGISPAYALTAYHGTPHKVDKFSTAKIGTGEGAQVYGWGLYMAENPAVAEEYAKSLGARNVPSMENLRAYFWPGRIVPSYGGGHDRVIRFNEAKDGGWSVTVREVKLKDGQFVDEGRDRTHQTIPSSQAMEQVGIRTSNKYTVHLNAEPDELLDWDKPLNEQGDKVKQAISGSNIPELEIATKLARHRTGNEIYHSARSFRNPEVKARYDAGETDIDTAKIASEYLSSLGIKGIRYLDQGSRQAARTRVEARGDGFVALWGFDGRPINEKVYATREEAQKVANDSELPQTYNYVIFNDADITITHENGERVPTAEAVNNPPNADTRFAAGEFDFGAPKEKPVIRESRTTDEETSRRISAINRELNTLNEKENRSQADERRILALQKQLGQMDLPIQPVGAKNAQTGTSGSDTAAAISAGQSKRLIGGEISNQQDIFGEKPKGQQSFFAEGDVPPPEEPPADKPEREVPGQVAGVRRVGQMDIQESIPNAQRRIRTGYFDGTQPVDPTRTALAWDIAGQMTNQEGKMEFARSLAKNAAPEENGVREIAPSLLVSELWQYAMRMAINRDDSLMRMMVNRSRDFGVDIGGGQSTAGRVLRGLQERGGLFKLIDTIAKRRAEQEGRRLGIGFEKYTQLIDALNNAALSEDDWNRILNDATTADGRTIADVIERLPGVQSKTTRETLELERAMIGILAKNEAEARRWMNRLEILQAEWRGKPEAELSIVRQIVKNALDLATEPARDGQKAGVSIWEDSSKFTEPLRIDLAANGVSDIGPNSVARRLAFEIWKKAVEDFSKAQRAAITRAAKGGIGSLVESIMNSPQALQNDPKWLKDTAENWLMSNGLSREQAQAVSENLVKEFQSKLQQAREKIARRIIDRGPPKSLEDIIAAIRAGLTNPDQQWSDLLAAREGWKPLTPEQNKRLAELELQYSNPGLSPHERVAVQEQMNGVLRNSNLHDHKLMNIIAESQAASLLSGVRTSTLHIFQPLVSMFHDLPVQGVNFKTFAGKSDFVSLARAMVTALGNWKPEFQYAWQKDAYSFSAHQTGFFHNELKRQFEIGSTEIKSANPKTKAKGVMRIIFGTQQYVIRALQSANQAGMAVTREWKMAMYGSRVMREAGFGSKEVSQMVDAIALAKEAAFMDGKLKGLPDNTARVRADDMMVEQIQAFFDNKGAGTEFSKVVDSAEKDAYSSVGRRAPGISEFDEGFISKPMNLLISKVSEMRRSGGAGSIAAVMGAGFVNIPFRMTRYLAGFSPYGLLRYGIHEYRVNRGKETFWKQSYANEIQAQARLRDAVVGTALLSAFVGWQYDHHTSDDDSDKKGFWIYATGVGPKSRVLRDAWDKKGFKPLSLNIVMDGKVAGAFPITRVGEILAAPLGLAATLDDLAWKRKESAAAGNPPKTGLAAMAQIPWAAVATYWDLMATKGIFQTATHITQLGSGGGGGNTELMLAKAVSSAVSPIVLPFRQLLSNVSDWLAGPLDRSSVESATAANFPIVGLPFSTKSINRFGDELYDQSWTGKLTRTGLPFMMHTSQTPENEALYGLMIDKGAAPPELRRSLLEDRYGPVTDDQYAKFATLSGDYIKKAVLSNLASLQDMTPEGVKSFLNKTASDADNLAAANLALERQKPSRIGQGGSGAVQTSVGGISLGSGPASAVGLPKSPVSRLSGSSGSRSAASPAVRGARKIRIAKIRTSRPRLGRVRRISFSGPKRSKSRRMRLAA